LIIKLKMKKILLNKYVRYGLLISAGIFLGWLFFHTPHRNEEKTEVKQVANNTIWTCSMHPQIRMHAPGLCPICGMDLIPVNQSNFPVDSVAVHLTKEAAQLANVLTTVVSKSKPVKEIRLYGKVQADERLLQSQVSQVPGRIEQLLVNYTGEYINRGQPLALIYSPELVTAQEELLEAAKMKESQPEIYQASRERLLQWKLTGSQIDEIEKSGKLKSNMEIVSNSSGIITAKRVSSGDYVSPGTVLYDVADLSKVWVLFDAYESDIHFISKGDKIDFTIAALPGTNFSAAINFIDPMIDPMTRIAKVRVEMNNESGRFKPEMFATGIIEANMDQYSDKLIIPASAVLWTGKRSVVYVKQPYTDEPVFRMREIELGPMLGNSYVVEDGLSEGEEIVTQGAFSVDAAAQLEGKPSMMNRQGEKTPAGEDNGDMQMEGMKMK
jgi:Cu(I)/Ag(I) efflux system membrane fusion protein